ncbi:hypothetical protein B8A08_14620, partial [Staphylococcus aureus]
VQAVRISSLAAVDAGFEADEYQSVLDMLEKAAQASGMSVVTLSESITKHGAPMRSLRFEMEESSA